MLESLQTKLNAVFDRLAARSGLTEEDVDATCERFGLPNPRLTSTSRSSSSWWVACGGARSPAQGHEEPDAHLQRVVKDRSRRAHLKTLGEPARIDLSGTPPHVVMLVGLQGSGKTTTAGKLALTLRKQGKRSVLVITDTYRPAAVTQAPSRGQADRHSGIQRGDEGSPAGDRPSRPAAGARGAVDVVILDAGRPPADQ